MNVSEIDVDSVREITAGTTVAPQFPSRWSPRAINGTALTRGELNSLLEAARWAPSCFNA